MSVVDEYRQMFTGPRRALPYDIWGSALIATIGLVVNQSDWDYFALTANSPESLTKNYESSFRTQIPEPLSFLVLATTSAGLLMRWIRNWRLRQTRQHRGFEVLLQNEDAGPS